jgi:hypothetical protein
MFNPYTPPQANSQQKRKQFSFAVGAILVGTVFLAAALSVEYFGNRALRRKSAQVNSEERLREQRVTTPEPIHIHKTSGPEILAVDSGGEIKE